jgi:TetR/AcrR family transcriptional regulator
MNAVRSARRQPKARPATPKVTSRTPRPPGRTTTAVALAGRGGRRAGQGAGLTREAILDAARREFAVRGYTGAGVDRIAAAARVNKAMIYYHFASKAGLYRALLRELFERAGEEVRAAVQSRVPPEEKLDRIVAAISGHVHARRELPAIMMREVAEGARHLDPEMLRAMSVLFQSVAAVVHEGQRAGRFDAVRPLLVYFTLVAPLVVFLGAAPVRAAMGRVLGRGDWDCTEEDLRAHLQRVLRRLLIHDEAVR